MTAVHATVSREAGNSPMTAVHATASGRLPTSSIRWNTSVAMSAEAPDSSAAAAWALRRRPCVCVGVRGQLGPSEKVRQGKVDCCGEELIELRV